MRVAHNVRDAETEDAGLVLLKVENAVNGVAAIKVVDAELEYLALAEPDNRDNLVQRVNVLAHVGGFLWLIHCDR